MVAQGGPKLTSYHRRKKSTTTYGKFPLKKTWKLAENATAKNKSDTSKWRGGDTVSPKTTPQHCNLQSGRILYIGSVSLRMRGSCPTSGTPTLGLALDRGAPKCLVCKTNGAYTLVEHRAVVNTDSALKVITHTPTRPETQSKSSSLKMA